MNNNPQLVEQVGILMKQRILIVDDEKNTREGLKWSLEADNYEVDTAEDGLQAWDKIQLQSCDLVITDLKMPVAFSIDFFSPTEPENLLPTP